jgi:hypothetical protein
MMNELIALPVAGAGTVIETPALNHQRFVNASRLRAGPTPEDILAWHKMRSDEPGVWGPGP